MNNMRPGCTTARVSVTAATAERRSRRPRPRSCSPDASTTSSTCLTHNIDIDMSLSDDEAQTLLRDDGAPVGGMTETAEGAFEREFEKTTVRLSCSGYTANFQ
eukprot:COSAG06_NODE_9533_length_1876_cov_1.263928_1_plen_103_part_00